MPTMMRDATISFPMLGDWSIDPSASFTLFGHTFYWYGAIIAVGFILAMLYCARHCRRCGIKPDTLYDFLIWMIPLAIIGARLYYVIFQWSDYREHPLNAFKIWEGGLAIYGGVIAGILTGIIWCRKRKIPFGAIARLVEETMQAVPVIAHPTLEQVFECDRAARQKAAALLARFGA